MKTAPQFHEHLVDAVKQSTQEIRDCSQITEKEHSRQGDVYCHRIASRPAAWDILVTEHTQVALGATTGSRHIATGNVRVYWPKSKPEAAKECPISLFPKDEQARLVCLGPIVEADESWTLTHPEHAHHCFPAGTYLVTYQLDWNTKREVRD